MSHVIAISNEKGGVAKTTTTLSLGAAIAELGQKVLVVDLDPQANLTLALGVEPGSAVVTSSHILIESAPLMSARHPTEIENLDLIPAQASIENAEQYLPVRPITPPDSNALWIMQRLFLMICAFRLPAHSRSHYHQRLECRRIVDHSYASRIFFGPMPCGI